MMILAMLFAFSSIGIFNTGCETMSPTQNMLVNLAIKAGIVVAVTENPALGPILNSAADVFMNPADAVSPDSIREKALQEINEANWPENYKLLAKLSLDDVILVYQDFYDKHRQDLTDSELVQVLNRIGASIKLGANLGSTGGAVPNLQTDSGLIISFD